ncbi:MAG: class I SAM-dependent methyltransferase [Magnetococcales bacterium]|nr:class I SAM-dependent methyltransferase [Magnetococcales bacterium]
MGDFPKIEDSTATCPLCGGGDGVRIHPGNAAPPSPEGLRITDAHYGTVGPLFRCPACDFRFTPMKGSRLDDLYAEMEDPEYERTRPQRLLQAAKTLETLRPWKTSGRLLDIGAGSGILVEAAVQAGYQAEGIDPSAWLCQQAARRGWRVHAGVLPHPEVVGPFDVVVLMDVLEHVADPLALLDQAAALLPPGGVGLILTPDVRSLAARLLGFRWWHYRLAHVGYFSRANLALALGRAGLEPLLWRRPGWYFPADYLFKRVMGYLPPPIRQESPALLRRFTVPLNLGDSLLCLFRKPPARA